MGKKGRDGKEIKKKSSAKAGGPVKVNKLEVSLTDYLDQTPFMLRPTSGVMVPGSKPGQKSALFFCTGDGDIAAVPEEMLLNPQAEYAEDDDSSPAMVGMEINAALEDGAQGGVVGVANIAQSASYPGIIATLTEEEEVIVKKPKKGGKKQKKEDDEVREYQMLGFYNAEMETLEMTKSKVASVEVSTYATTIQWSPCGRFILAQAAESVPVLYDEKDEEDEEDEEEEDDPEIIHSVELFAVSGVPSITRVTKLYSKDEQESACFIDLSTSDKKPSAAAKRNGPCLMAVYNNIEGAIEIHNLEEPSETPAHVLDTGILFPSPAKEEKDDEEDEEEEEEDEMMFKSMAAVDRYLVIREVESAAIVELTIDSKTGKIVSEVIGRVPVADDGDATDVIDTMPFLIARGVAPFSGATGGVTGDRSQVIVGIAFSDSRNIMVFSHKPNEKLKVVDVVNLREDERPRAICVQGGCDNMAVATTLDNPTKNLPLIAVLIECEEEEPEDDSSELLDAETVVRMLTLGMTTVDETPVEDAVAGGSDNDDSDDEDEDIPDPLANCYGKFECTQVPSGSKTAVLKENFSLTITPVFAVSEEEELEDLESKQTRWGISRTEKITNVKGGKGEDSLMGYIFGSDPSGGVPPRYWIEWNQNQGNCRTSSFVNKSESWNVDMKLQGVVETEKIKSLTRKLPTGNAPAAGSFALPAPKATVTIETVDGFIFQGPK